MSINNTKNHACFSLRLHMVFVTKYRRKTLNEKILDELKIAFSEILEGWKCSLIEFGGEADHIHILIDIHPNLEISKLVNNLKSATAHRMRNRHEHYLKQFYSKPVFWHRAYFVSSVGNASLDTIKAYIENQGTTEKPRKAKPSS